MQLVFVLAVFSFAVIALLMAIEKYVEVRMPGRATRLARRLEKNHPFLFAESNDFYCFFRTKAFFG
ncbi:hypothetical protein [Salidesulfovibrio brasiliensis]